MSKKYTYQDVYEYIANLGAKLLTTEFEYKDMITKLEIMCGCGNNRFYTTFKDLLRSKDINKCKCKICGSNNRHWSYGELKYYADNFTNTELLTQYDYKHPIPLNTKLKLKCYCGNIFTATLRQFYHDKKHICNNCSLETTSKRFRRNIKDTYKLISDKGYTIVKFLKPYKNAYSKFVVRCPNGHEYISYAHNLIDKNRGCAFCFTSNGENKIRKYLQKNNINYVEEYRFDNCRNDRPLPFDFYLPDYNLLIEYDGKQHFKPINFFGGQDGFKYRQYNDNIKNKYCEDNNIPLFRISYKDFDRIEELLQNLLSDNLKIKYKGE